MNGRGEWMREIRYIRAITERPARRAGWRRAERRRAMASAQSGYSLIEVLISVMLVGTVIAALAAGMLTMVTATRSVSEQQRLEAGVLSFTEWLRAQDYGECAGPGYFHGLHPNLPLGAAGRWEWREEDRLTARVDDVKYWQNDGPEDGEYGEYGTSCTPGDDLGRQRLNVTVALDGGPSTTVQVVVRDDIAPAERP
jgi:prepilin-type N-terminal cleavage/methylation domain-containing protein